MATTPGFSEDLAAEIAALYARAQEILIGRMAEKIASGVELPDWEVRQLTEVAEYRRFAQVLMATTAQQSVTPITAAMRTATARGDDEAVNELAKLGRRPNTNVDSRLATNLAAQLHGRISSTHQPTVNAATSAYQRVVNESLSGTATGVETRQQGAQRALNRISDSGVSGFRDAAGRQWQMDTYVEMSSRTAMMNATVEGHTQRLLNEGEEFVVVSDHPQECKICRPWEGQILSLTGARTGVVEVGEDQFLVKGTLADARKAGLFHPNCRHSYALYIPGVSKAFGAKADPEGDKARQKLRRLEREKRALLLRKAAAIDPAEKRKIAAKIKAKTDQIKEHVANTDGLKRSPNRESLHTGR